MPNEKFYSVSMIANKFGCSEKTIRRIIKSLDIDVQCMSGNTKLYSEIDLPKIQQQLAQNHMLQGANSDSGKRAVKEVLSTNFETSPALSARDYELISRIVAMTVTATVETLKTTILGGISNKTTNMSIEAPKLDCRAHITQLVRNYARSVNMPYQEVYSMLYTEYGYRTHSNPSKCAMNREMKIIDYLESCGVLPQLDAVATEILVPPVKFERVIPD